MEVANQVVIGELTDSGAAIVETWSTVSMGSALYFCLSTIVLRKFTAREEGCRCSNGGHWIIQAMRSPWCSWTGGTRVC